MSNEASGKCDGDVSNIDDGDVNTSFVNKVKSTVSGIIPSSVTKWFGSNKSVVRQRDDLDDDDEDEELNKCEPPAKKAKLPPVNHLNRNFLSSTSVANQQNLSLFSSPMCHGCGPSRDLGNCDSDSGESTSGYSSMPRIGSKEQVSDFTEQVAGPSKESSKRHVRLFNNSSINERTLFTENISNSIRVNQNESLSSRRPSFNASVIGSSNFLDRTLTTRRIVNSPFYSGRTTYGGAAAHNRHVLQATDPTSSSRHVVKPRDVQKDKNVTLSKTAKRILETLEQYTSPVQDVKRIPYPQGSAGTSRRLHPYGRELLRPIPKTELQVPTMTNLLKMKLKERLQDSTTSVRQLAAVSSSPLNTTEYKLNTEDSEAQQSDAAAAQNKRQNKIRTKVVNLRQKAKPVEAEGPRPEETVKLPDIQLPITTLPSFNFTVPSLKPKETPKETSVNGFVSKDKEEQPSKKETATSVPAPDVIKTFETPKLPKVGREKESKIECHVPSKSIQKSEFRFSNPLVLKENIISIKSINNFKFSKPVIRKPNGLNNQCAENFNYNGDGFKLKKRPNSDDVVDIVPAKELISQGSVLDILGKGAESKTTKSTDTWECSSCWIRNVADKKKCAACEAPKPNPNEDVTLVSKPSSFGFGDEFKMKQSQWECTVCLVRNDSIRTECVACSAPNAKPAEKVINKNFGFDYCTQVILKPNQWECSVCLVRNNTDVNACVSCTSPRNKPVEAAAVKVSPLKVEKKPSQWECPTCMIKNNDDKLKCACCETPKPGTNSSINLSKAQDSGKNNVDWECPSCMVRNASSKSQCVCCETPKPGSKNATDKTETPKFGFGINNGQINGHGFTFGIPSSSTTEKSSSGFASSAPSPSILKESNQNTPSLFSFGNTQPNGAKPEIKFDNQISTSNTNSTTATPPTFTFGVPKSTIEAPKVTETPPTTAKTTAETLNGETTKPVSSLFNFGATPKVDAAPTSNAKPADNNTSSNMFKFSANTSMPKLDNSTPVVDLVDTSATPPNNLQAAKDTTDSSKPMFSFGSNVKKVADDSSATGFRFTSSATTPSFNLAPNKISTVPPINPNESRPLFGGDYSTPKLPANLFNTPSSHASGQVPSFTNATTFSFGAKVNTPAAPVIGDTPKTANENVQKPFAFGAPAFNSNAADSNKSDWKATTNGMFNFGSKNSASGMSAQPVATATPAFNFGAQSAELKQKAFNFGAASATPALPTFNFTGGTPSAFTAQAPDPNKPSQRVIRKALRRTHR